ncbi:MAG TPA: serine/threonine-protein kinase [Ktedonobacteraceae bacterium]|nr:serine/threonine-protein kinase [Ktedonobacteraceae bacterium]
MEQDALIGTTLGNYRILEVIGQGGMARVYKAHQETLGRDVAVKVLPPWYAADRSFVERFNLEARLVARLSHPNIVTVHDANEQNGHLYIVMQLVDGGTLKHRLDQLQNQGKMMDTGEAIPIFSQLADALTYAHEQGVIHRDIKPVNVLLDRSGRPILSDFGIAKVLASTQAHLTRPGAGVGTPEYMSPEQCQGGAVDGRADIYALGVMLFESLTGCTPFQGDNYPALAHKHIYELPPYPSSINPAIHPAMERIILTALMKNPLQRYQTAREMGQALKQVQMVNALSMGGYYVPQQPPAYINPAPKTAPGLDSPSMIRYSCPRCQNFNKPEMRFCTRCGYPLNQCTICGKHNPVKNRFCIGCGQPLTR